MSLLEVKPDALDLVINANGYINRSVVLKFKRTIGAHVIFSPNTVFWDIWHGNKSRLKKYRLSVDRDPDDRKKWEVWMPMAWYKYQLTPAAQKQFNRIKGDE